MIVSAGLIQPPQADRAVTRSRSAALRSCCSGSPLEIVLALAGRLGNCWCLTTTVPAIVAATELAGTARRLAAGHGLQLATSPQVSRVQVNPDGRKRRRLAQLRLREQIAWQIERA